MWPLSSYIATTFLLCHVLASTPVKGECSREVFVSGLKGEVLHDVCSLSPRHHLSLVFSCSNQHRSVCLQPIKSLDVGACEGESLSAAVPVVLSGTSHKTLDINVALVINVDGKLEAVDTFHVQSEVIAWERAGIQLFNAIGKHRATRIQISLRQVCETRDLKPLERSRRENKKGSQTADDVPVKIETSSVVEELGKDDVIFSGEGEQAHTTIEESVPVLDDITRELLPSVLELDKITSTKGLKELPATTSEENTQLKKIKVTGSETKINDVSSQTVVHERPEPKRKEKDEDVTKQEKDVGADLNNKIQNSLTTRQNEARVGADSNSLPLNEILADASKTKQVSMPFRVDPLAHLKEMKRQQSSSLDDLVKDSLDKLQVQMQTVKQRVSSASETHLTSTSSRSESTGTTGATSMIDDSTSHRPTSTSEHEQADALANKQTTKNTDTDAVALASDPSDLASSRPHDEASTHDATTAEYIEEDLTSTPVPHKTSQPVSSSADRNRTETSLSVRDDPLDSNRVVYSATADEPLIAQADEDTPRGVKEITDQDFLEKLMQSLLNQSSVDEDIGSQTPLSFSKPTVPRTSPLSQQTTVPPVQPRDVRVDRNNSKLLPSGGDSDVNGNSISPTEAQTIKPAPTTTRPTSTSKEEVASSANKNNSTHSAPSDVTTTQASIKVNIGDSESTTTSEISDTTIRSSGKVTESADTDEGRNPASESPTTVIEALSETTDATRFSSSALDNMGTNVQGEGSTSPDKSLSDTSNTNTTTEPTSSTPTKSEYTSTDSSPSTTTSELTSEPTSQTTSTTSQTSTTSETTSTTSETTSTTSETTSTTSETTSETTSTTSATTASSSTRDPTLTESSSSTTPSTTTSNVPQSSTSESFINNTTDVVTEASSSISNHSENHRITTVDVDIPGQTPGPLLATSSEAKRRRFPGETGDDEEFWPIVAGLVIGIPSIIVFGIAITVIHKRRKIDTSRAFYLGGHHHRHSIDV